MFEIYIVYPKRGDFIPRTNRNLDYTNWAHIILRGINRENIFYDKEDYLRFYSTFERYKNECNAEPIIICLMSNHVHLLMGKGTYSFSQLIKKIAISYASYYNKKYCRVGYVFQDRFRSEPIDSEEYLLTVLRYIYQNPSKAGICKANLYPYTYLWKSSILSTFFSSNNHLFEFLASNQPHESEDKCLDFDSTNNLNDSSIISILENQTGNQNPQFIQQIDKYKRDIILRNLKQQGATIRQLSRITGLNRNIIQRA